MTVYIDSLACCQDCDVGAIFEYKRNKAKKGSKKWTVEDSYGQSFLYEPVFEQNSKNYGLQNPRFLLFVGFVFQKDKKIGYMHYFHDVRI